eukprot:15891-Heterococcus_DN1.PRE.3
MQVYHIHLVVTCSLIKLICHACCTCVLACCSQRFRLLVSADTSQLNGITVAPAYTEPVQVLSKRNKRYTRPATPAAAAAPDRIAVLQAAVAAPVAMVPAAALLVAPAAAAPTAAAAAAAGVRNASAQNVVYPQQMSVQKLQQPDLQLHEQQQLDLQKLQQQALRRQLLQQEALQQQHQYQQQQQGDAAQRFSADVKQAPNSADSHSTGVSRGSGVDCSGDAASSMLVRAAQLLTKFEWSVVGCATNFTTGQVDSSMPIEMCFCCRAVHFGKHGDQRTLKVHAADCEVRALLDDYRQFNSDTAAATTSDSADSSNRYGTATAASAFATDTGTKTASNSVETTARSTPAARRRTATPHSANTPYSERMTALTRATSSFNLDDVPDAAAIADMWEARDSSNTTPPPASLLEAHAQPRTAARRVSTDDDTQFSPFAVRHSAALASLRNRSTMSPLRQPGTAAAATTAANYTTAAAATGDVTADDSTSAAANTMASLTDGVHGLLRTPLRSAMQVASPYYAHTAPAAAAGGTASAAGTGTGTSTAARRISFDIDSSDEANAGNDIDTEQQQLERTGSFLWELALSESKSV